MEIKQIEPAKVDRQTILECTKCGKEMDCAFDFDPDEDTEMLKKFLKEHEFMCTSDFPDFEVKEKSETELFDGSEIGQVLYRLWDTNVEVPNETEHTQYNKGYMHALAHVKKQVFGGDNFPGELKELSEVSKTTPGETE